MRHLVLVFLFSYVNTFGAILTASATDATPSSISNGMGKKNERDFKSVDLNSDGHISISEFTQYWNEIHSSENSGNSLDEEEGMCTPYTIVGALCYIR